MNILLLPVNRIYDSIYVVSRILKSYGILDKRPLTYRDILTVNHMNHVLVIRSGNARTLVCP